MGYADVYHMARPRGPRFVVDCLINYLGYFPQTVVDLGCGTGLSTRLWGTAAAEVIGVEPSPDMIAYAQEHRVPKQNIRFVNAFAHETGLAPECADLVTCSQSFHWMEPEETLQEVNRILKPGGILPPTTATGRLCATAGQRKLITTCNAGFRSLRALPRIMQIAFYVGRKASIYPVFKKADFWLHP